MSKANALGITLASPSHFGQIDTSMSPKAPTVGEHPFQALRLYALGCRSWPCAAALVFYHLAIEMDSLFRAGLPTLRRANPERVTADWRAVCAECGPVNRMHSSEGGEDVSPSRPLSPAHCGHSRDPGQLLQTADSVENLEVNG